MKLLFDKLASHVVFAQQWLHIGYLRHKHFPFCFNSATIHHFLTDEAGQSVYVGGRSSATHNHKDRLTKTDKHGATMRIHVQDGFWKSLSFILVAVTGHCAKTGDYCFTHYE